MPKKYDSNILINILEFGKEKLLSNHDFSKAELQTYLKQKHGTFADFVIDTFLKENFEVLDEDMYRINSDGYSRLLNQQNLRVAKLGIFVAISLGIISIILSVWSNWPKNNITQVELTQKQLRQILKK